MEFMERHDRSKSGARSRTAVSGWRTGTRNIFRNWPGLACRCMWSHERSVSFPNLHGASRVRKVSAKFSFSNPQKRLDVDERRVNRVPEKLALQTRIPILGMAWLGSARFRSEER